MNAARARGPTPSNRMIGAAAAIRSRSDLEDQLRGRLRFIAALNGGMRVLLASAIVVWQWRYYVARPSTLFTELPWPGVILGAVVLDAVFVVLLAKRRRLALRPLRIIEGILFGGAAAAILLTHLPVLPRLLATPGLATIGAIGLSTLWSILVLIYAVFIPNTWQRCATVLALVFVAAMGPDIVIVLRSTGVVPSTAALYLFIKATIITGSAAAAVWSAYRIEILELDVEEARKIGQYVLGRQTPKLLSELGVSVSAGIGALITRCLAKRPEDRFESAAALEQALFLIASKSPLPAPATVSPAAAAKQQHHYEHDE